MCDDYTLKLIHLPVPPHPTEMHFPDNTGLCAGQRSDLSTFNVVLKTRRDSTTTLGEIN